MNRTHNDNPVFPSEAALHQARVLQHEATATEAPRVGIPWKFWLVATVFVAVSAGGFFGYQQMYKKQAEQLLSKASAELSAGRLEQGVALLREAATAHNAQAQYQLAAVLAVQYLQQHGRLPLRSEAGQGELFILLDKAVQAGEAEAAYLASVLSRAAGSEPSHYLALLGKAADAGLFIARLDAASNLGKKYAVQPAYLASLAEAAAKGWHVAQVEQAALEQAQGDAVHARQWLEQAQQAGALRDRLLLLRRALPDDAWRQLEQDYRHVAAYRLSMMMDEPGQREAVLSLLQRTADTGLPAAKLALAEHYLDAQKGYWQPEKARAVLESLAHRTLPLCRVDVVECAEMLVGQAKFKLAVNHYLGVQGFESVAQAFDYLKQGNEHGEADATYLLGWVLLNGRGVPADVGRGVALITQAAAAGIAGAKVTLAKCYLQGLGVTPDRQKAKTLLQDAAAQGDGEAAGLLQKLGQGGKV
ncbi:tetratricopeptide repeat protein [Vogesella indigofera]|uniref:tetratricopeptide repeat protein n=1 Tax=Vogesella indigofera TaxID=45465 RepID=UPI00234E7A7E|nr:hypothetical protein [Vogesella indigofera]MDC7712159.1 hypothetical protein [Vogesella indigofera]